MNFKITKMAGCAEEIDVVDESDEEIQRILEGKDAKNTKRSTKFAIRASVYLQTAEECVENLDKSLARFFQMQKKDGSNYKANALQILSKERAKKVLFKTSWRRY